MRTNLINNFKLTGKPSFSSDDPIKPDEIEIVTRRKVKPDFDIHRELANRTFIQPLPPKGHIIKNSITSAPQYFVDDVVTDFKALKSAWKGDANDHQLGKLNDLGMKLGGLTIAAYLFSMKKSPVTKAMEFVGFGSFFASMALWPKIALDLPARLIHGFSPFMMYQDSQGRKKRFFNDNQFIAFDMLSDKDINRIGNHMRIPKNIPNRRDAVQEKMRQIALQNNTMWMLTAGFATPIMSSLICNRLQPYVEKMQSYFSNKKVDNILVNFSTVSKKFRTDEIINNVNRVLELNSGKPVTEDIIEELSSALVSRLDPNVKIGVKKDLQRLFPRGQFMITETQTKSIYDTVREILKRTAEDKMLPQNLSEIIPTHAQIDSLLTTEKYYGRPLDRREINEIISEISLILEDNIETLETSGASVPNNLKRRLVGSLLEKPSDSSIKSLEEILTARPSNILDDNAIKIIKGFANEMTAFCSENTALNVFSYQKLAQAPNTAKAKYWNDVVGSLLDILKITPQEIQDTRFDRTLVGQLFNKKIWEFATSSPEDYKKFVGNLSAKLSQIEKHVKPDDMTGKYIKQVENSFNAAATRFRKFDPSFAFEYTARKLVGYKGKENGSLMGITKAFVNDNLSNLKNTFAAVLNKVNTYRTLYKNPDFKFLGSDQIPREIKEEITGFIEYLTTEGRIADYSVKFEVLRNLRPNKEDKGSIAFNQDGSVNYKYYNREKLTKHGVFIPSDISFFKRVMTTLFGIPLNPETAAALADHSSVKRMLEDYRNNMASAVGNMYNFMFPDHVVNDQWEYKPDGSKQRIYSNSTPKYRSNTVGAALDEVLANACKESYNTRKWLKMFGGFGAGLLGFTVLSQFFFGRGGNKHSKKGKV